MASASNVAVRKKMPFTIAASMRNARPRVKSPACSARSWRFGRRRSRADDALEDVVHVARDAADLRADVVDQAERPGSRDRLADLWRLGDTFDQFLNLVAGQQALPDAVDHLAVDRPVDGALDGGALQGLGDRPLRGRALERTDDGVGGQILDRLVDPRGLGDTGAASGSGSDHTGQQRLAPAGPAARAVAVDPPLKCTIRSCGDGFRASDERPDGRESRACRIRG